MSSNPTIVVQAYKRVRTLARLLASLDRASYIAPTTLIISIDQAESDIDQQGVAAVTQLAAEFVWRHGPKRIISHPARLGLVAHNLYCQSLTVEVGPLILLEDDLVVSATFHHYAAAALERYRHDPRIAGVSLNALWYNGLTRQPFIPLPDEYDVFFLQLSTPQGQLYTPQQWLLYRDWLDEGQPQAAGQSALHELLVGLPPTDWLPIKDRYLVETGRTYVYPRESQTVNFGDVGTHFDSGTAFFQVPLQQYRHTFAFAALDVSLAIYDAFFEMLPDRLRKLAPPLSSYDFAVDLYATKHASQIDSEYMVTTRPVQRALWTVGKWYQPLEANLFGDGVPGNGIALARTEDVDMSRRAELAAHLENNRTFNTEGSGSLASALADRTRAWWQGK